MDFPIEIRFYRRKEDIDSDYYTGNQDIYAVFYFESFDELDRHWNDLIYGNGHWFEGETYSAWIGERCLCGGKFDTKVYQVINSAYHRKR